MAEGKEGQFTTLAERIAALNQQRNFTAPPPGVGRRPPPPPNRAVTTMQVPTTSVSKSSPVLPPRPTTDVAPPLPRRTSVMQLPVKEHTPPSQARILPPPRSLSHSLSPALPPRRPSAQMALMRRDSNSSDVSYISTMSNLSLNPTLSSTTSLGTENQASRRLPPALDQAKLPPLPPSRREIEANAKQEASPSESRPPPLPLQTAFRISRVVDNVKPSLPPRRPSKFPKTQVMEQQARVSAPALPSRRLPPRPERYVSESVFECEFGSTVTSGDEPPPVPLGSRPSPAQIDAVRSRSIVRSALSPTADLSCLVCRDYTGPDQVAAQYPLHSIPRDEPVSFLADVLCASFPSHTDKARAIFTWCHHNIAYDVHSFFNHSIPRGQTPAQSILSGKGVCEGYARIFESIGKRAGLDCIIVGGHGKGFGHKPIEAGQPPPGRDPTGHAWNAVRIEDGAWKLVDCCWGAGHVSDREYVKKFSPWHFTSPNEEFSLRHFPQDPSHFFHKDGSIPTWEEYMDPNKGLGPSVQWYGLATEEGLNEATCLPKAKAIPVHSRGLVRFQFSKVCQHWMSERHGQGKQLLYVVNVHGPDGKKDELVLMEHDGFYWWADIPARDLGCPGQSIVIMTAASFPGGKDGRGMSNSDFYELRARGGSPGGGFLASWDLV